MAACAAIASGACQRGVDKGKDENKASDELVPGKNKPGVNNPGVKRKRGRVPAPPDVAVPPADATVTKSGLAYKHLEGTGSDRPLRNDTVAVHYTGWRTNGDMFYTTKGKRPKLMALNTTAPGWTEALELMAVGEKRRLWIPPEIGFKKPGPNAEMLVFDVELVEIIRAPAVPEDLTPPKGAKQTESGLAYQLLAGGRGTERPRWFDTVAIHYTAWDSHGTMFESTHVRNEPPTKLLFREGPGLSEGIQSMAVGDRKRLWIPAALVERGVNTPEGDLVYDVELVDITRNAAPPPVPDDVSGPPPTSQVTERGVHYVFLSPRTGGAKPAPTDRVTVHYTGWTTAGRMFDSSVVKGQPAQFAANGVIAGWTDALQLMGVGDKARIWVPAQLAYEGNPTRPQGMLVFDMELIAINGK